ncbi:hypothetical protein BU23DRAFT_216461 [Bimuria novae-zelandiae CBS 107.79]|uniref:Serine-rich protein n=1 Tax=Bimuria novae-zelandiae CBS 107.79 TaxID=1447943 RepID=A0A6A5VA50_9PLEO|nr:hypothetical protein BU23DRAFT_216461 [Bimuria novae-zelandiae CBS 107.79]
MSVSASRRSSASDTAVSSPLARAPRFSPPSSRTVSPTRRPLHQRSDSQTNQYAGPTIRIVQEDPESDVYSKHPFPSQPSQILPPRKVPGYGFERRGSRVSDTVAKIEASQQATHTLDPKPLKSKKLRHSASTNTSDADTIAVSSFSPLSSRFSQDSTTRSSPTPESLFRHEKEFEVLQEAPASPLRSTIRAVTPSTVAPSTSSSADAPTEAHALTPRASAASLASTANPESSTRNKVNHKRGSSNISLSPSLDRRHKHTPSFESNHQKQASSNNTATQRPTSTASTHSLAYTDYSYNNERPRSASQPIPTIHEAQAATVATGVPVNYPIVRAPSASSLWASSQEQLPTIASRMNNRSANVHQWSSQLSTIPSESERDSRSLVRASHSFSARSQSQDDFPGTGRAVIPRRRLTAGSVSSSDNVSSNFTESSVAVPLPLFSPTMGPLNDDRNSESEERHDTISPLQSPPLRMKTSFIRRWDSDSRSTTSSRPSSSQSDLSTFIASTIPAWARVYYRRGERTSLGAPESISESSASIPLPTSQSSRTNTPSDGNFPFSIYRPRNRPHQRASGAETASISEGPVEQDVYVVGGPRRRIFEQFTPRLAKDRRSQAQLSAWKAPSFDENFGAALLSRQNRQIVCFCLGFIFPFAWMMASVLPLPPDPDTVQGATASELDLEQRFDDQFGPVVDKSYQKARWWRNLNRVMSGVGTLLIGVIIALAVLASRMS